MFPNPLHVMGAGALVLALAACSGSGESDSSASESESSTTKVVEFDFTGGAVGPMAGVEGGTVEFVDGALRIAPESPDRAANQAWSIPEAGRYTITADWGPTEGTTGSGLWGLALGGNETSNGLMLACWSDGTPPELLDLDTLQAVAVAPNGSCGPGVTMTLTIDNTVQPDTSSVTFSGGGSDEVDFESEILIKVSDGAYIVGEQEAGFSVDMTRFVIETE